MIRALSLLVLLFSGCSPSSTAPGGAQAIGAARAPFLQNAEADQPLPDPTDHDRWWLEKTVRLVRGGDGLRAGENPDELLRQPPEKLLASLMQDPRFGNLALDFNMYFLGFKADRVRPNKTFDGSVYSFPNAIDSARQLLANGDYFRVFDFEAPLFLPPVVPLEKTDDEKKLPNLDVFRARNRAYLASGKTVVDYARKDPAATAEEACTRAKAQVDSFMPVIQMGVPQAIFNDVMIQEPAWYGGLYGKCYSPEKFTLEDIAANLESAQELNAKLFAALEPYADDAYKPGTVPAMLPFDATALGLKPHWIAWGATQRKALTNSSTNMDRKRAAYVLKRFFCDDLTPVGIDDGGADHTGGSVHASQPSCIACHYKLDPMAGFFRTYGSRFRDFTGNRTITFDDNARTDLQQYMSAWRAEPGKGRDWNVGYVRSATDESRNDYGSTLPDLHALFRRVPEVKSCLVRRMFEYAVGDAQTMDPGFLDSVASEFASRASTDSSGAFRWLVTKVALSGTFRQSNPDPNECYDRRPGTDPASSPPCRVAYLLQQNCKSCHASTTDKGSLDLTRWAAGPDGALTFPHLGDDGKPLPLATTLQDIVDRLITNDPDERMPKKQFMAAQDRQALYTWAQNTLNALPKKGRR